MGRAIPESEAVQPQAKLLLIRVWRVPLNPDEHRLLQAAGTCSEKLRSARTSETVLPGAGRGVDREHSTAAGGHPRSSRSANARAGGLGTRRFPVTVARAAVRQQEPKRVPAGGLQRCPVAGWIVRLPASRQ